LKLYRIFIPKVYNNGKPIEDKKIRKITDEIRDRFKGYSANPESVFPIWEGAWEDDKIPYTEPVICIELFTQDTFDNQSWIRSQTELWRQLLKQKSLFVLVQHAEMIRKIN